ncbi:hypothetical protein [Paenibacillus qinlingensis]|uniref:Uncharacterized protein n=1 Tax=Paenibacillus qinlingensis TaxID=1837343 RepID=A0ABU1P4X9_9BACL|nr:hypothetical protein [Paenibacillus qinlingensis]MDR6554808.1 hypothetical protein [Paenibacillus qinlingensis]
MDQGSDTSKGLMLGVMLRITTFVEETLQYIVAIGFGFGVVACMTCFFMKREVLSSSEEDVGVGARV